MSSRPHARQTDCLLLNPNLSGSELGVPIWLLGQDAQSRAITFTPLDLPESDCEAIHRTTQLIKPVWSSAKRPLLPKAYLELGKLEGSLAANRNPLSAQEPADDTWEVQQAKHSHPANLEFNTSCVFQESGFVSNKTWWGPKMREQHHTPELVLYSLPFLSTTEETRVSSPTMRDWPRHPIMEGWMDGYIMTPLQPIR